MHLLDRYVITRFLANFLMLFALLFVFAVAVDVIVQLEEFTAIAAKMSESKVGRWLALGRAILDFHGPQVFRFYAYMLGIVSIGAMGFTLVQMVRSRELVAIMAAGTSLLRVGFAIVVAATGLNLLQLVNQEVILPRLAPLLVRDRDEIMKPGVDEFEVSLTRDGAGNLMRARQLSPADQRIEDLLYLERDAEGAAIARIEAPRATWNDAAQRWDLENGRRITRRRTEEGGWGGIDEVLPVSSVPTDLSPEALLVRRYAGYAQMLSLKQLREMREQGGVDPGLLSRLTYLRLGAIGVNLLVLIASIPFFLLREPANLLKKSVLCAAFAIPACLGSFIAMTLSLPGLPPAVSVFLPVAVLLPVAMARVGAVRT